LHARLLPLLVQGRNLMSSKQSPIFLFWRILWRAA
jgi:hypothetical protein